MYLIQDTAVMLTKGLIIHRCVTYKELKISFIFVGNPFFQSVIHFVKKLCQVPADVGIRNVTMSGSDVYINFVSLS